MAHLACIALGAPAYRLMGAGEKMARAAEAGKLRPTLVTLAVTAILLTWAAYALAGAGIIGPLPFTRPALAAICAVYLGRAVAFPLLKPAFPDNSQTFWLVSSSTCLVIGVVHAFGLISQWPVL
ncbi:hypothetical protein [Zoogloea sp.]|uniref:hypothetical protein n=1 Tax=Zoogloea sp. TaxID=49181 RepID=UPI0031FC8158